MPLRGSTSWPKPPGKMVMTFFVGRCGYQFVSLRNDGVGANREFRDSLSNSRARSPSQGRDTDEDTKRDANRDA